ncbi:MAG TPA: metallophosphoesterase family protein [Abditibacteriaceae bacterium]|jgi:predicted phosphodiesterase
MRLAVLSDIHSNFVALEAVALDIAAQSPDAIVVAGDFLNRGPQPRAVWEFLRERGWPLLRGNHEDYVVAQCVELDEGDDFSHALWQPARWTAEQLGRPRAALEQLPLSLSLGEIQIWHGTVQRNNDGVFPNTPDAAILERIAPEGEAAPPLFCCGHTHQPLVRRFEKTLIVNAGAAGLPFDGDARGSWALLDWNEDEAHAEIRRVEYDRDASYRAFEDDGFLRDGGPLARVIRREIETARPHLGPFVNRYADAVRAGTMALDEAVNRYLHH